MDNKDIFISYRREDGRDFAQVMVDRLEKDGYSVFFDQTMHTGEHFPTRLEEAIKNANDFIMVVSASYWGANSENVIRIHDEGDWVRHEIRMALENKKRIIPIVICKLDGKVMADLPDDIVEVTNFHQIHFGKDDSLDFLICKIEDNVSDKTKEHRNYSSYLEKFHNIGSEDTPNFNVMLRKIVLKASHEEVEKYILPILESDEPDDIRFLAYYAVYTFYRRLSYNTDIANLVGKYGEQFSEYKFNNVIYSQFYRHLYEEDGDVEKLELAIDFAKKAMELIEANSGVFLTYAELIAIAVQSNGKRFKKYIASAVCAIEEAIELKPNYPKSLYIRGLLLGSLGKYKQGIGCIQKAIALEDTEQKDSFLRVIDYKIAISEIHQRSRFSAIKRYIYVLFAMLFVLILLIIGAFIL